MIRRQIAALALLLTPLTLAGCKDDGVSPRRNLTFRVTIENVSTVYDHFMAGTFDTPVDADMPGPAGPGAAYEFEFAAPPGARLSFASMFGQSNDLFYAPGEEGIALFDAGQPIEGDVTSEILLWDAGTEANQEPGTGSDQAPRQPAPDTGPADDDATVRLAEDEFGNLPAVSEVMRATLTSLGGNRFRLRLENVGSATVLPTSAGPMPAPFSPGAWVVHTDPAPMFSVGTADRGSGLERIAEEGSAGPLGQALAENSGVVTPLSPGVWAVHAPPRILFREGDPDRGEGLERIAEDADPSMLAANLEADRRVEASGLFDTPVGGSGPGPIMPGQRFEFTVEARRGDHLSFATMFGQSNDLFYGPGDEGIALFATGLPTNGDVTPQVMLWDAGTEVIQVPGGGPTQAPGPPAPDTGEAEDEPIALPDDDYVYPDTDAVIRVTITPELD